MIAKIASRISISRSSGDISKNFVFVLIFEGEGAVYEILGILVVRGLVDKPTFLETNTGFNISMILDCCSHTILQKSSKVLSKGDCVTI